MSKSLFSILIFLLVIFAFLYLLNKFVQPRLHRIYKWKTNLLIAGAYLALLILSIPLGVLFDQSEFLQSRNAKDQGLLAEAPSNWSEVSRGVHIIEDEPLKAQAGLVENSHQTFEITAPQLEIRPGNSSNYGRIFLEQKEKADGIIEVSTYVAPHQTRTDASQFIDFTKMIPPPKINFEEGILRIEAPIRRNLVFKDFSDSFLVNQFKEVRQDYRGGSMIFGEKVILIRVPSDVEVFEGESGKFNWVH